MRFQVPQFTDVEDKIVGPLTFKQFIYIAGSAGACVVFYYLIPWKIIAFILMVPVIIFGGALAFYKVNNRPFIRVVESYVKYFLTQKLYIWKHSAHSVSSSSKDAGSGDLLPSLGNSKLKDITWNLDVKK
jgi:hypothetical protein